MNAERLLALYERVADAPDAVERLRRFVLDLAVRGKLVEQAPGDEPAARLLKRIAAEKARLVKAGEIKKPKKLPPMKSQPFDLPSNWCWVRIREITSDRGQRVPDTAFTYIDVSAINKEAGIVADPKVLAKEEAPSRARKVAVKGDVLYSCVRPYLLNVAVLDHDFDPTPIASTAFAILNGHGLVLPWYLWITLRSPFMVGAVEEYQRGQAYPAINDKDFAVLPVPLPPLAEQHRIVAKVDELMALLDRLEAARTAREATRDRLTAAGLARLTVPDNDADTFRSHARFALDALPALTSRPDQIKQLRQTILDLAVRGRLVEQDPADESASELVKRISNAKTAAKRETGDARIKPAPSPDPAGLSVELPRGWSAESFENLFLFIDYRGRTPPKTTEGVPLITAKNVRMGSLNREPREFIAEKTFKAWMTRGLPQLGDLFFTTEAPLANICINEIEEPFALAQRVICFQPYAEIDTRYLMFAIMSDVMQGLIEEHSTGLTAKGIKAAKLKPLPLPIPPLAEQHRIVARVDALMALCDRLEATLASTETTRARLLEVLLHEALEPAEQQEVAA